MARGTALWNRRTLLAAVLICIVALSLLWQSASSLSNDAIPWHQKICSALVPSRASDVTLASLPQKKHRIAVASTFGFHHDVYMAVVWTLQRVLTQGSIQVYAPFPFAFDFQTVVELLDLYNGTVRKPDDLISDLSTNDVDLLILGTCEVECVILVFSSKSYLTLFSIA